MKIVSLALALSVLSIPSLASAHFLWASLDPATQAVAIGLQEVPDDTPVSLKQRIPLVKAWSDPTKPLALKEDGTWLKAPAGADAVGVSLNYGVLDKREEGRGLFWLYYYAKAALTPEASQKKLGLGVELSVRIESGGWPVVTVLRNGKPAPKAAVVAEVPGAETTEFKGETGPDGTLRLPAIQGRLAVRALVTENVKGTEGGKAYDLRRSYGTLTVQSLGGRPMVLRDAKAYALMERASLARQTMPKDVREVTGMVAFVREGKTVEAPFTFRPGTRATIDKTRLDADAATEVEGQVASLFNHRQSVPFANGNGKYDLTVVSEDETGTLVAIGDELKSSMRVKGDEIVEVNRIMHGNRFIISTLETMRTPAGKSLPKVYAVSYFDPQSGALTRAQYFTDAYTEVNGVWLPLTREIKTAEGGRIRTVQLRFRDLKVVRG